MEFRSEIRESLTLKFAESAARRKKEGKEIVSLGLGEPDFDVPLELIEATIRVLRTHKSGYSSPMGLPSLREKIAAKLTHENGIVARPSNILVVPGAKQAFQLAMMALLEPGDEVVILSPSFVSFIPQVYIAEPRAKVVEIDMRKKGFKLPVRELEAAITSRTKAIVVNSPNNPAGYVLSLKEVELLYRIATAYGLFIVSDEVYEKLAFSGHPPASAGSLEPTIQRVFTVNGFSKSHGITGWRLGYLCFPESHGEKLLRLQQHINTNTCTFIQEAMAEAFEMPVNYLTIYRRTLKLRAGTVVTAVNLMPKLSVVKPRAGFFAFIDISKTGLDSNTFCGRLIEEKGVALTPGIAFGRQWDDHVRLSFAVADATLRRGLDLLSQFVASLDK
jgi:aspartate aminotransferase